MADAKGDNSSVANRTEVLQFLTDLLRGGIKENDKSVRERLKAAELLGKGCGAFEAEAPDAEALKVEIEIVGVQAQERQLWPTEREKGGQDGKQVVENERS